MKKISYLMLIASFGIEARTVKIEYERFDLNYSCEEKAFIWAHYLTKPDTGNLKRYGAFKADPNLDSECLQQLTTTTYKLPKSMGFSFDRGHGVHQNILDDSFISMKESNYFTNIVPQDSKLNRTGLWRTLEKRVECARDLEQVEVWLGNIWTNPSNDYFVESHGVKTPDYLWRVHSYENGSTVAWLMPNTSAPKKNDEQLYQITLTELDEVLDYTSPWNDRKLTGAVSDKYANITCNWG